jgi:sporulation protein YlmC with PRC-barrel domain
MMSVRSANRADRNGNALPEPGPWNRGAGLRLVDLSDGFSGAPMRKDHRAAAVAGAIALFGQVAAIPFTLADDNPPARTDQPEVDVPAGSPAASPPANPPANPPAVVILKSHELKGILGKEVRSATGENMGRIVDVVVDRNGQVRAGVIDFGGFLGVGSRKIAVDWDALKFPAPSDKSGRVTLEFTRDQVKAGPEYQEGKPVVVLGSQGKLEPFSLQ